MHNSWRPAPRALHILRGMILLTRHSPAYWRVTFNHEPLNIFGPHAIPRLNDIVTALETDEQVKVVVFDSAVEGFFLTHYDFLASLEETTRLPPGPTGLQPLPDVLVRLSRHLFLVGETAEVIGPDTVRVRGEIWSSRGPGAPGQRVRVAGVEGLTLVVEPEE